MLSVVFMVSASTMPVGIKIADATYARFELVPGDYTALAFRDRLAMNPVYSESEVYTSGPNSGLFLGSVKLTVDAGQIYFLSVGTHAKPEVRNEYFGRLGVAGTRLTAGDFQVLAIVGKR